MMEKISIETTQNVTIEYPLASVGDRVLAYIIDIAIIVAYVIAMIILYGQIQDNTNIEIPDWLMIILVGFPYLFYDFVSEIIFDGQTIGKKIRGIKVIALNGRNASIGSYLLRWLLRPIDGLMMHSVAMITIVSSGKGQRLGDMAAGTCVVDITPSRKFSIENLPEIPVENSYQVTYPQVSKLSDRDIQIVEEVLRAYRQKPDGRYLQIACNKVTELLALTERNQNDYDFLVTIVKDYRYITGGII